MIPLRPLGVGEILDGAVSTMRAYWRTVLGISLTVAIVTEIVVILLQGLVLDDSLSTDALNDSSASFDEVSRAMGDVFLSSGVLFVVSLIGTVIATALLTTVTSRAVLGKPVSIGEAWRDARPQVAKLFGLILLLLLTVVAIIIVGIAPGILVALAGSDSGGAALAVLGGLGAGIVALWLMIRFSLASPALMLEKQGIVKSISRSAKLVSGSWWRVFGIQLLATIIANVVASIVVLPFTFLAAALTGDGISGFLNGTGGLGWTFLVVSGIGSVIGSMVTFPITAGVTVLLYIDQRIRREALDLDLARAAGVQGYGSGAPAPPPGADAVSLTGGFLATVPALPRTAETAVRNLLRAGDTAVLSLVGDEPPVTIPRDPAREAAQRELSKRMYHENDPGLFQRAMDAFWDWLDKLFNAASTATPGGAVGLVVVLLAVVAVIGALWWRLGTPRIGPTSSAALFDDRPRSAAEHRAAAEAHAAQGHWNQAVQERMRAVVRSLEERALLDTRPGRTADEAAAEAGRTLPAHTDRLRTAARDFDDVTYGGRTATPQSYRRLADLDDDLERTKPALASSNVNNGSAPDKAHNARQGAAE